MDLKIKDVADLFNVAESTVKKWVLDGKIPSYKINQHLYFSRTEIENWVIARNKNEEEFPISPKKDDTSQHTPLITKKSGNKQFCLFRALHKGDVLQHVKGESKEDIIRSCVRKTAKLIQTDADIMTELLLDRERLVPTALGNGIAVPHTRDSLLRAHHDIVIVATLDEPLEFGALDGQPVHTLFFLFACEDKRHLQLLAKIAHLSKQEALRNILKSHPTKKELLNSIKEWEKQIPSSA